MAIEISDFAKLSLAVSPTGVSTGNFGILGFLTKASDLATNPILPAERARAYTGLKSVGGDWQALSEVYKCASAYYQQTPTPTDFVAIVNYDTAQPATLVGGGHITYEELVAITAGSMNLSIDGTEVDLTSINFSAATDLDGVASIINTAVDAVVSGATCTYGAYGFIITGGDTGASATVTFASGDVGEALGFATHQAKVSNGIDAETPLESLAAAYSAGVEWIATDLHKEMRDKTGQAAGTNTLELAEWNAATNHIFLNTTNDLSVIGTLTTGTPSQLKAATVGNCMSVFSRKYDSYPASSAFGRAASVDFQGNNTTLTLNLKPLSGVFVEDLTPNEYKNLTDKYCNAVVKIGKNTNAFVSSRLANGSWFDTAHGLMWVKNHGETGLFNLYYQEPTKVPFDQTGINISARRLEESLQAAVRNGLAGPGKLTDGTFLAKGYRINKPTIQQISSSDKGNRILKGMTFDLVGKGALHGIEVSGNFVE